MHLTGKDFDGIIKLLMQKEGGFLSGRKVLADIKRDLDPFVGDKVRFRANKGRKKVIEKTGILESTYPNIFVVRLDEKQVERRVSFSYADLLTDAVQLTVFKDEGDIDIVVSNC